MTTHIAVLFVNYGPYHIVRVKSLVEAIQQSDRDFAVVGIELARQELEYAWKAEVHDLSFPLYSLVADIPLQQVPVYKILIKLFELLHKIEPDIIAISGYAHPAMLAALLWSKLKNKSSILFSETGEQDFQRNFWQEQIKGWLIRRYMAALVGGSPHVRYLIKLGMKPDSIFLGYDVVDNQLFHPDRIRHLPSPLAQPYFLAISRFVPKKNLLFLIRAYSDYRRASANHKTWDLVLCGDGELRQTLEVEIEHLDLQNCVHLPGFLQQNELLPYFAHAQCFIHASIQEQWGLVVNEAMAAGLPILVSNRCGCIEDLLIDGVNGFGFDPKNKHQLTDLMLKISDDSCDRTAMAQAALAHIQNFSSSLFAEGFIRAVEYIKLTQI